MDCGLKWTLVESGHGRKWTLVDFAPRPSPLAPRPPPLILRAFGVADWAALGAQGELKPALGKQVLV